MCSESGDMVGIIWHQLVSCDVCHGDTKCDEMKVSHRQPMKTEEHGKEKEKNSVRGQAIHGGNAVHPVAGPVVGSSGVVGW